MAIEHGIRENTMKNATRPIMLQGRFVGQDRSVRQIRRKALDCAVDPALVLVTTIGQSLINRLEKREKDRFVRAFLLIAGGFVSLFGVMQLAVQLVKG
jgi:hypothetical protein